MHDLLITNGTLVDGTGEEARHADLAVNDGLITEMAEKDLPALEVYHRDHSPEQVETYEALAKELGLLATGGSDFHRPNGDDPSLGCAHLTEDAFERLRAAAQ